MKQMCRFQSDKLLIFKIFNQAYIYMIIKYIGYICQGETGQFNVMKVQDIKLESVKFPIPLIVTTPMIVF